MTIINRILSLIGGCTVLSVAASCVKTDFTLGNDLVPDDEKFYTSTFTLPIEEIEMAPLDKLSGFSSLRINIGSIRDEVNGVERISRRGSAVTLIPLVDTLDWGSNPQFIDFFLTISKDSLSVTEESQKYIMQNIRVYDVDDLYDPSQERKPFAKKFTYSNDINNKMFEGKKTITLGTPMYGGSGDLKISFTEDFAKKYMGSGKEVFDSVAAYTTKHPGIYLCTDDPMGQGGRFNFFNVALDYDSDTYYIRNCYAQIRFKADFGTKLQRDTTIIFSLGATSQTEKADYYAFNVCEQEYLGAAPSGKAHEEIIVEGGTGLKPVIKAEYLREAVIAKIKEDLKREIWTDVTDEQMEEAAVLERVILNRATIILPFSEPSDYSAWEHYPSVLNPTLRVTSTEDENYVTYGGLTDASVSDEDQGDINYSRLSYRPDITHHLQQIIATSKDDSEQLERENLWFLILAEETFETKSSSNSNSQADFYSQMAYLNYYNNMMGGYGGYGYGGYGYGYGGYGYGGYGYDNYYNYYMMQAMYSSMSSGSSTTTTTMLDKDRYYNCRLNGPEGSGERPKIKVTYSFVKKN